jgi:hypothetical protein
MILESVVKIGIEFIVLSFFKNHRLILAKDLQFFSFVDSEIISEIGIGFYEL